MKRRLYFEPHAPRQWAWAGLLVAIGCHVGAAAWACPFCVAMKPTFAQQRETAVALLVAEIRHATGEQTTVWVHQRVVGQPPLAAETSLKLPITTAWPVGQLVLALAQGDAQAPVADWEWTILPVDELRMAYFLRSPDLRRSPAERLGYFARYLEHGDPTIADDAYLEFAHAPFDQVRDVAEQFEPARLIGWLNDPQVRPERHGLYGLLLGLVRDASGQAVGAKPLSELVRRPGEDFRAGFDGLLGGWLMADPKTAIDWIETELLAPAESRVGDVRHAMRALRFYQEFGRELPAGRLNGALARLLTRAEFAAEAVVDLARWQAWEWLADVVALWQQPGYDDPTTRRAIAGYLLACPLPAAQAELARLRQLDPAAVERAEQAAGALGAVR